MILSNPKANTLRNFRKGVTQAQKGGLKESIAKVTLHSNPGSKRTRRYQAASSISAFHIHSGSAEGSVSPETIAGRIGYSQQGSHYAQRAVMIGV
jgi:hypothetical protein